MFGYVWHSFFRSKLYIFGVRGLKKFLSKICNLNVKDDGGGEGGAQAFRIKFNCIVSALFCLEGVVDTKYAVVYFDISNRERKKLSSRQIGGFKFFRYRSKLTRIFCHRNEPASCEESPLGIRPRLSLCLTK